MRINMYIHMCIYIYIYLSLSLYIYIYIHTYTLYAMCTYMTGARRRRGGRVRVRSSLMPRSRNRRYAENQGEPLV